MFRLILKDFYLMRVAARWLAVYLAFRLLWSSPPYGVVAIIISVLFIRHSMVLDDKYRTDSLYCSLPLKRSAIVFSRYLSALFVILAVTAFIFILSYLHGKDGMTYKAAFLVLFYLVLFFSVFFPFYFRFGTQMRTELGYISIAVLILFFVIVLIGSAIYSIEVDILKMPNILLYASLVMILFTSTSVLLSLKIYSKREF
jgi:ABC-type transport system involved in multi-copper enzyme maturation permease subunit